MAKKKGKKDGLSGLDAVVEAGKAKDRIAAAARPDQESQPPENRMDVNVLAASAAASMAYGTTDEDGTTLPRLDATWLCGEDGSMRPAAECAAAFLRTWPDGKPDALAIHLRRAGFAVPEPGRRERVAWAIFAATLAGLDGVDRADAEERKAKERRRAQRPPSAPREDLTLVPDDGNPLSELGRRARARL